MLAASAEDPETAAPFLPTPPPTRALISTAARGTNKQRPRARAAQTVSAAKEPNFHLRLLCMRASPCVFDLWFHLFCFDFKDFISKYLPASKSAAQVPAPRLQARRGVRLKHGHVSAAWPRAEEGNPSSGLRRVLLLLLDLHQSYPAGASTHLLGERDGDVSSMELPSDWL